MDRELLEILRYVTMVWELLRDMARGIRQVAEGVVIGNPNLVKLGQDTIQCSKSKFKDARRKRIERVKQHLRAEMEEIDELEPPAKKAKVGLHQRIRRRS